MSKIIRNLEAGNYSGIRSAVAGAIKQGSLSKRELRRIIQIIKCSQWGNDYLSHASVFNIIDDETAWSKEYLDRMATAVISGDFSEVLLEHMVDVSHKVNARKRTTRTIVLVVGGVGVIIVALLVAKAIQ